MNVSKFTQIYWQNRYVNPRVKKVDLRKKLLGQVLSLKIQHSNFIQTNI